MIVPFIKQYIHRGIFLFVFWYIENKHFMYSDITDAFILNKCVRSAVAGLV
jgi:hypothetical protein